MRKCLKSRRKSIRKRILLCHRRKFEQKREGYDKMIIFAYRLAWDTGFAPCLDHNIFTLACCKGGQIRKGKNIFTGLRYQIGQYISKSFTYFGTNAPVISGEMINMLPKNRECKRYAGSSPEGMKIHEYAMRTIGSFGGVAGIPHDRLYD